jgi:hypothetical protein
MFSWYAEVSAGFGVSSPADVVAVDVPLAGFELSFGVVDQGAADVPLAVLWPEGKEESVPGEMKQKGGRPGLW